MSELLLFSLRLDARTQTFNETNINNASQDYFDDISPVNSILMSMGKFY